MEMVGRDAHDALVVFVARQHLLGEGKPGRGRQAIVFEDDSLCFMCEEPVDRRAYRDAAAEVFLAEQRADGAGPVDGAGDIPYRLAAGRFVGAVGTRSVRGDV